MIPPQTRTVLEIRRSEGNKNPFFRNTPVTLYRTWRDHAAFAFMPTFRSEGVGRSQSGDIAEFLGPDKMTWVRAGSGGVSLSDKLPKLAGRKQVIVPALIYLPMDLVLGRDSMRSDGSYHFTIHPVKDIHKFRYIQLMFDFEKSFETYINRSGLTQL